MTHIDNDRGMMQYTDMLDAVTCRRDSKEMTP